MPLITIQTLIKAPAETVFDLSRNIDLHKMSAAHTGERAIAGKTSGLIGLHETVTWRAKHFGVWQNLTSRITEYERPLYFVDEMTEGIFSSMRHEHHFTNKDGSTVMTDHFRYRSPLGILGQAADWLFLKKYMTQFLVKRNRIIKEYAEGIQIAKE